MSFEYQNDSQNMFDVNHEDIDSNGQIWINGELYQLHQSHSPHVQNLNICTAGSCSNVSPTTDVIINVENGYFTDEFNNALYFNVAPNTLQNEIPNEFLQDEPNNTLAFLNYEFDDHNTFTYVEQENLFSNEFSDANYEDVFNDPLTEAANEDVFINTLSETTNEDVFTTNQLHEATKTGNDESTFTLPFDCGLSIVQEKNDLKINSHDIPNISEEENIHFYYGPEINNEVIIETEQPEDDTMENELKFGIFTIEPIQETVFQTKSKMHEVTLPRLKDKGVLVESEEKKIHESFESSYVKIEPIEEVVYGTDHKPEEILVETEQDFGKTADILLAVINENSDISNPPMKCPYDKCKKTFTRSSKFKIHIEYHNGNKKFKCPISNCTKGFNQKVNLDNHVRTHTGSKPFKCSYCNKSFTQQGNMKTHERKHISSNNALHNCKFCEEKFINRDDLHKHMQNHKPLQCLDCEDQFKIALDLHTHVKNIHKHKTRIYHFCFRCNLMFNDKECLDRHNYDKHQRVNDNNECIECKELFSSTKELIDHLTRRHHNGESFLCRYCKPEKGFDCVHSLINHVNDGHKKEKPHRCDLCGERFPKDLQLIRHSKLHESRSFECQVCHHLFSQKGNLKTHLRKHTGQRPFKCDVPNCGKDFSDYSTYCRHKRVHTKEKPYQCEFCLRCFSQLSNLKCHRTRRHGMSNASYECEFCVKQFNDKNELENHSKLHTGDRRYICQVCLKTFKQWANLKCHMQSAHPNKGVSHICEYCDRAFESQIELQKHKEVHIGQENPYICNICQKTYGNSSNLKKHIKLHTCEKSHICRACGKKFLSLSSLKSHELIHEVDRPHKCNQCTKSFINKYRLRNHMMIHTGEKPYTCSICPQKFRSTTSLKRHIAAHNKNTSISPKCSKSYKTNAEKEYRACNNSLFPSEQPDELFFFCKICNLCFKTLDEKNNHQINHICDGDDYDDDDSFSDLDENLVLYSKECEICDHCHVTFETEKEFKKHLIQCVPLKQNCTRYAVSGLSLDISLGQMTEECSIENNGNKTIVIGIEDVKREPLDAEVI